MMDTGDRVREGPTAFQTTATTDDTAQQIADLFSVPRTTVYGHLNDASEGKRPTIHRNR